MFKLKHKLKLFITLFIVTLLLITPICFATDDAYVTAISSDAENSNIQTSEISDIRYSDLYISDEKQYDINNTIDGNIFASLDSLTIDLKNNSLISGNVYATAKNVNIKSDIIYSSSEKDEIGNFKIETTNDVSVIYGNVFVTANKFVLEPECEINGDLYVCANEIELGQNSVIYGNVFVVANNLIVNSQISGDLYASVNNFDMPYYGFIRRDLHLTSKTANLDGYIYRNSFIDSDTITTNSTFVNECDFNVENASNLTFSGEVKGNANINSKNIEFKNKDDNSSITCKIAKDLNYSSNTELQIEDGIVYGNINYSKYVNSSKTLLPKLGNYLLELLTTLICIIIIYLIINKFAHNYINKISSQNILISLAIGLGILIGIPLVSILLFITRIGSLLAFLLLLLYVVAIIIAKPIFIIAVAELIKNKILKNNKAMPSSTLIYILVLTIILSLISLIPCFGFIISLLVMLAGLGVFVKSLLK